MALSKSTRIKILLVIDIVFFLLEVIIGYSVHSLALVADSFHMLNDILSLFVGLWAIRIAHQRPSEKYTYGWQRAETLGALVNGVFLVALCLSIFLEAIQRFVEPQTVSNPFLVLIVGCCGLVSNILGLFLFHEHGHSHGHSHDSTAAAESGLSHAIGDESGNIVDVLPETFLRASMSHGVPEDTSTPPKDVSVNASLPHGNGSHEGQLSHSRTISQSGRSRKSSASRRRFASVDDLNVHPASFRKDIIAASRMEDIDSAGTTDCEEDGMVPDNDDERTALLGNRKPYGGAAGAPGGHTAHGSGHGHDHDGDHSKASKGGHSHSDLNMRGVFLHVMGDALGNIGVIGSALFIWLTPFPWRFYSDPVISLIITLIILASAIPLCLAASRILLQGVPAGISVDEIKANIQRFDGVVSCHHVHVWQLSDTKLIASLHVQLSYPSKGDGAARYMQLALAVRKCLHRYGIHSSTIQPEFSMALNTTGSEGNLDGSTARSTLGSRAASQAASMRSNEQACLLDCGDECRDEEQCCNSGTEATDAHD